MDVFAVWVMAFADWVAVDWMRVPGKPPAAVDMAVVLMPPDEHDSQQGDLANV
jgi:hypothetical protein